MTSLHDTQVNDMRKHETAGMDWVSVWFVVAFHVLAVIGVYQVGISWRLCLLALGSYLVRMWAVTVGYHRYFSHRAFKTSRVFQFIIGVMGTLAVERGPLWWGALHRRHHTYADSDDDIHSPTLHGFFWAYIGWMHSKTHTATTDYAAMRDFKRFRELYWLNEYYIVAPLVACGLLFVFCDYATFVWVVLVATVVQWHALFASNTFCHLFGSRRFDTKDTSTNNAVCALLVLGEGWHNNHHFFPGSARQGFYWWEYDVGYYSIKLLQALRLVWDVREVPARVLRQAAAHQPAASQGV
jgi:stearoyl-CoA desaturase (Delta-9 desaturase)